MSGDIYKEVVAILMDSEFYFELSLEERRRLVKRIAASYSLSGDSRRPGACPAKSPALQAG